MNEVKRLSAFLAEERQDALVHDRAGRAVEHGLRLCSLGVRRGVGGRFPPRLEVLLAPPHGQGGVVVAVLRLERVPSEKKEGEETVHVLQLALALGPPALEGLLLTRENLEAVHGDVHVGVEGVNSIRGDVAPPAHGAPRSSLIRGLDHGEKTVVERGLGSALEDHYGGDEHLREPEDGTAAVRLLERLAGAPRVEAGLVLPDCEGDVVVLLLGVGGLGGTAHALHAAHERKEAEAVEVCEAALSLGPALLEGGTLAALKAESVGRDVSLGLELAIG